MALAAALRQNMKGSPLRLDTSDPLLYVGAALLLAVSGRAGDVRPRPPGLEIRPPGSIAM